jgi:hypothetical protein
MSQVRNLAFFRARRGQSEALDAALAALVEPTRLSYLLSMILSMRQVPHTLSTVASRQPDRVFRGNCPESSIGDDYV